MKLKVLQENLLRALVRTGRNVSASPQLPILQSVLLETEEGRLRVTTSNLQTTEAVWAGAKTEEEGGACAPARLLTELVASLPPGSIELTAGEGGLAVVAPGTRATMPVAPATEFPPLPQIKDAPRTKIKKYDLVAALNQALFAAATDEGRPLLTGIKIKQSGAKTLIVATDGYRLSVQPLALPFKEGLDVVVPARALAEISRVGAEEKEADEISFLMTGDGQLQLVVGDTELTTRVLEGSYPDFEKIIPQKFLTRAIIEKAQLLRAAKSAAIFARDNANIIRLKIADRSVVVSANAPQTGKNEVEIEANIEGDGGEIAFNSRFLLEFLNNFTQDRLVFEMTGSLSPGVFKNEKDDGFLHIIMPVRVTSG